MALQNRKINPWKWQDAFGFSQAIETTGQSRVLRVSGQTSVNAEAEPQHEGDMAAQMSLAMDNLETVCKAADMTLANVVQLNIYTTDIDATLQQFEALGVTGLFNPALMVEIEATAVA